MPTCLEMNKYLQVIVSQKEVGEYVWGGKGVGRIKEKKTTVLMQIRAALSTDILKIVFP